MAMSARATNIGGMMVAETRNGERRYHCHDAMGNTIALVNDDGKVTDSYDYWPNGEVRVITGSSSSTPFKYGGAWGYYDDGNQLYVRTRYLREKLGRWITRDPIWPIKLPYAYALLNPIRFVDPTGLACKPKVTTHLDKGPCEAECYSLMGVGCYCKFELRFLFNLDVDGAGCKSCKIYQFVAEVPNGKYEFDQGLGWPYPWTFTGPPRWGTTDEPAITGGALGCPDLRDHRQFISCVDCDGFCECWVWSIQSEAKGCKNAKCSTGGPFKRNYWEAFTRAMCAKGRKGP